jgi:SAM-dependent methyltransferase
MFEDPKRLVADGYDRIADRYEAWAEELAGSPRRRFLAELLSRLPQRADVLELGCGGGLSETRELAAQTRLTGVDLSREQVVRARRRVPGATFVHADLAVVDFDAASFDAVVAFYVLNHLPQADQRRLPARVHRWLRPGGYFLASHAASPPHESVEDGWLGTPMFFASIGRAENRTGLEAAGFDVLTDEVVGEHEPEGEARFHWLLAQKLPPQP